MAPDQGPTASDRKTLRVAAVGCGPRALVHLAAAATTPSVDIVAACDLDESRLTAAADAFGVERRYTDMAEMIAEVQPDLVDIVTPPSVRASIVSAAIEAGAAAILIEKPLALTSVETERLRGLAAHSFLAVNTQYRWMPHWRALWPRLERHELGDVHTIRVSTRANLLEQGPHVLDLALEAARLSGLPEAEWVFAAACGTESMEGVDVPADLMAVFGLGEARLVCQHGPSAPGVPGTTNPWLHVQVEVAGTRGRLWVSLDGGWHLWTNTGHESGPTDFLGEDDAAAQRGLLADLRDSILAGRRGDFPVELSRAAYGNDLLLAACNSSRERHVVALR